MPLDFLGQFFQDQKATFEMGRSNAVVSSANVIMTIIVVKKPSALLNLLTVIDEYTRQSNLYGKDEDYNFLTLFCFVYITEMFNM